MPCSARWQGTMIWHGHCGGRDHEDRRCVVTKEVVTKEKEISKMLLDKWQRDLIRDIFSRAADGGVA